MIRTATTRWLIALTLVIAGGFHQAHAADEAGKPAAAPLAGKKLPVPTGDALQQATELVSGLFKANLTAARTIAEKSALAQQILTMGHETTDDLAGRYVLFSMARDLGIASNDLETAWEATSALELYDVDSMALKAEVVSKLSKAMPQADLLDAMLARSLQVLDGAIRRDHYPAAKSMINVLLTSAPRLANPELAKQAASLNKQLAAMEAEFTRLKGTRETWAAKADDPNANLQLGKFQCFFKGDWDTGLPMLAYGNDDALKQLATKELWDEPVPISLGDAWWDAAASQKGPAQAAMQAHAAEWYRQAADLAEADKQRVDARLASLVAGNGPPQVDNLAKIVEAGRNTSSAKVAKKPTAGNKPGKASGTVAKKADSPQKLRMQFAPDAVRLGDHYYKVIESEVTWKEACEACEKSGGYLACFDSIMEQREVNKLNTLGFVWIGGYVDDQERWLWLDGTPLEKMSRGNETCRYLSMLATHITYLRMRPLSGIIGGQHVKGYVCEWNE